MSDDKPDGNTIICGNAEMSLQLTQTRTLKISCYIYAGEDTDALNDRIDAMQDVIDRQAVRCDITNKEAQIDAVTGSMRQYREHVAMLVEQKTLVDRGEKKLTSQEKLQLKQQIEKSDADLRNFNAQIESLQAAVKKGRSRLNGAAAP